MSTVNRWSNAFGIASGLSITYAILVGISILLIGVPGDVELIITTGVLVFLIYGILGFFAGQENTNPSLGHTKLDQRIGNALAYVSVTPPLFFIIGSIPNGIVYTWQSHNAVGVFICLALVVWSLYNVYRYRRYMVPYNGEEWLWPLMVIFAGLVINGTMRSLATLTREGLVVLTLATILTALYGFLFDYELKPYGGGISD